MAEPPYCRTCRGVHPPIPKVTPEQMAAWQRSLLDMRCRECGATAAASSWCSSCGGTDIEYQAHAEQTGERWCERPSGDAEPAA